MLCSSPITDSLGFPHMKRIAVSSACSHTLAFWCIQRWAAAAAILSMMAAMQGVNESLEDSAKRDALRKETPEQAAARLKAESKDLRQSVRYDAQTSIVPLGLEMSKSAV